MSPTFSNLYSSRLDRELGTDDTTILFTTARRKAAINEAVVEFANLTNCLPRWASIPIVNGQHEYDLNSTTVIAAGDFNGLATAPVEFVYTDASTRTQTLSGDDLPRRDVRWLDRYQPGWQDSTQASSVLQFPSYHYVRIDGGQFNLGLWPWASAGAGTAVLKVPYVAEAATLVSSTDVPFTMSSGYRLDLVAYHQGLVHYAASQLEKFRRDDQASDRQLQKFQGYIARYLQDQRIPGGRQIMQARSYFKSRVSQGWSNVWPWAASTPGST